MKIESVGADKPDSFIPKSITITFENEHETHYWCSLAWEEIRSGWGGDVLCEWFRKEYPDIWSDATR